VVPAVAQGLFLPCLSRWTKQWRSDKKMARTGAAASKKVHCARRRGKDRTRQRWRASACTARKKISARAAGGSDCTGKKGAPDTQTNKKRWREMTGQKKKVLARWQGSGEATGHKNAARQKKKVQRDKKGQVTDLRPVKKVLRD
jgi:hypothetical protein